MMAALFEMVNRNCGISMHRRADTRPIFLRSTLTGLLQDRGTLTGPLQEQATQTEHRQERATHTGHIQDRVTQTGRRQDPATQTWPGQEKVLRRIRMTEPPQPPKLHGYLDPTQTGNRFSLSLDDRDVSSAGFA
jgi:hypothetical protein